ncbi:response regulator [Cetobacterium sp. SF1]|uniref:response regulator n=1 Tax=unclassified Cetobacterium TaxID=2630983 RepID=UPI003CE707C3
MENTVVFIDDQEDFLELLRIRLDQEPYNKKFFTNFKDLTDYISNFPVDVIVCDINMPTSGIEVFKFLKKNYPNITRIALSSLTNPRELLLAINEGEIHKYIPKPWKVDEAGKKIILEAIDYSKFQNIHCDFKIPMDKKSLTLEEINKFFLENKIPYILGTTDSIDSMKLNENYYLIPRK